MRRPANRVDEVKEEAANRVDGVKEEAANRVDEAKEEEAYAIGGGGEDRGIECGEGQVRGEGRRIGLDAVGLRKKVNKIRGLGVKRKAEEMIRVNRRYRERERKGRE